MDVHSVSEVNTLDQVLRQPCLHHFPLRLDDRAVCESGWPGSADISGGSDARHF